MRRLSLVTFTAGNFSFSCGMMHAHLHVKTWNERDAPTHHETRENDVGSELLGGVVRKLNLEFDRAPDGDMEHSEHGHANIFNLVGKLVLSYGSVVFGKCDRC